MLSKEIQQKIVSCKALQGVTLAELIETERFTSNLAAYMSAQREDRKQIRASYEAMRKLGGANGYKIPAHPIDKLIDLSVDEFRSEYARILQGCCTRTATERKYIKQLCQQAFNLTVAQYVIEEYPELDPVLIPKAKAN